MQLQPRKDKYGTTRITKWLSPTSIGETRYATEEIEKARPGFESWPGEYSEK